MTKQLNLLLAQVKDAIEVYRQAGTVPEQLQAKANLLELKKVAKQVPWLKLSHTDHDIYCHISNAFHTLEMWW